MELWIRSQDNHSLMICKRITIIDNKENYVINADIDTWNYDIGIYKTKERALEVLDEIQTHLLKMGKTEILTNENGIINGVKDYGIVYKMPKD